MLIHNNCIVFFLAAGESGVSHKSKFRDCVVFIRQSNHINSDEDSRLVVYKIILVIFLLSNYFDKQWRSRTAPFRSLHECVLGNVVDAGFDEQEVRRLMY